MSVFIYPPFQATVDTGSLATATKQDEQTALLTTIDADTGNIATSTASIDTKTPTVGQKTMAASSPVVIASDQSAVPVSGPLTDAQLRASTVPISGTVTANTGLSQPLTDTQLRASAVPVSAASLPLPSGAATEATLSTLNGKVTAVNTGAVVVASSALPSGASTEATLSTLNGKVTAVNTGAVVVASSALPSGASTEATLSTLNDKVPSNLTVTSTRLLVDGSGVTQPVSGPLTDAQLRASVVPVSLTSTTITGTVAATQSGTWTVQPGNTANTTPWLVKEVKSATSTLSNVASSASNVTLLASNANRLNATIFNDSTQVLYVKFGTTASATSYTVQIAAGGYYELPNGSTYTGIIDGIWASANGNARVTELT